MTEKKLIEKNGQLKVMLGFWLGGYCLSHLQLIGPEDASDEDVRHVLTEIKKEYYNGIMRGTQIAYDDTNRLIDNLDRAGYDRKEVVSLIDDARGRDTEYLAAVAKLLKQKRHRLLKEIDYNDTSSDKKAEHIIKTYRIDGVKELKQPAVNAVDLLMKQCEEMKDIEPISAGSPLVNNLTGGLRPGQLVVVGARPGVGKTAYCLQIAEQTAMAGKKVLHIPLEMTAEEMIARQVYRRTSGKITVAKLNNIDGMTAEEKDLFSKTAEELKKLTSTNLLYIPGERELSGIARQIELHQPDLVVIDQLTLIEDSLFPIEEIRLRYKHAVETLKEMAMDYKVVILLAAQVNREGTKAARPTMSNLKEAGSIEESADVVFILHKDDDDDEAGLMPGTASMKLYIDKFRSSQAGGYVKLRYDYPSQTFTDQPGSNNAGYIDSHWTDIPSDEEIPF